VGFGDLGKLLDFQNLSLTDVIGFLQNAVDKLAQSDPNSFLNQKLPVLHKSARDLIDYTGQLTAKVKALEEQPLAASSSGQLSADAHLMVTVGSNAPVPVTIPRDVTAGNTSLDDLVQEVNTALAAAGLGAAVAARNVNGAVAFVPVTALQVGTSA